MYYIDTRRVLKNNWTRLSVISSIIKAQVVFSAEAKAEADNANRDLDISSYYAKTYSITVLLFI